MDASQYKGIELTPAEWAKRLTPLTVLELAMRVEKLGGWEQVELLTTIISFADQETPMGWMAGYEGCDRYYLHPWDVGKSLACPEGWFVYAVRRAGDGR